MSTSVGIIGASGLLGKYLVEGFLANGSYSVTLLARKGGNHAALQKWVPKGVKIVEADFEDEASLVAALKGLDIVVSAAGMSGLGAQASVIRAAKAAGVRRYVPSEFSMDPGRPGIREYFPALQDKFATRDALEASGLEYTYIVTGGFLETTFTPAFYFDVPNGKVTIKGNPDATFAITSNKDIARWTAAALLDPTSKNSTIHVKGQDMTMNQAVATIERATGKKLEVTYVSPQELDAQIANAPNMFAAFPDMLLRAVSDGWATVPQPWAGQDAPSVTLETYAPTASWKWE